MPSEMDSSDGTSTGVDERTYDLFCGIGPRHIHALCENGLNGGKGMTPTEVGRLTLDQVFFLLAKPEALRKYQPNRVVKGGDIPAPDESGYIAGRDSNGNKIKAKIRGESLVKRIRREAAEKKMLETMTPRQRRRWKKKHGT